MTTALKSRSATDQDVKEKLTTILMDSSIKEIEQELWVVVVGYYFKSKGSTYKYSASPMRNMIVEYDSVVELIRRCIRKPSEALIRFTAIGKEWLAMEYLVLDHRFESLFTDEDRQIACYNIGQAAAAV